MRMSRPSHIRTPWNPNITRLSTSYPQEELCSLAISASWNQGYRRRKSPIETLACGFGDVGLGKKDFVENRESWASSKGNVT